jgi:Asp-tRNA(Asn)/Glu-tRNA(Gln) amidotransferase A subunit family amidase
VPAGVDGIRIGVADSWFWDGCENGIDEIVRSAIDALARAGAVVKEKSLPEAREAFTVFSEGGVSAIELRAFLDRELPDWLATIDPSTRRRSGTPGTCLRANISAAACGCWRPRKAPRRVSTMWTSLRRRR